MAEKKYIEREAVLRRMQKIATEAWKMRIKANVETVWNEAQDVLRFFPAADVRPVVRGKWVDEPIKSVRYHCSVCQGRFDYTWHFCPNCGAKMEES